jgi:hypothetical protein
LISVILAGPCHLGVSLEFLPKGAKSSNQTRSLMLKSWGNADLSKLSLILALLSLAMFLVKKRIFGRSW